MKLGQAPIDIEMHIEVGNTVENLKAAIAGETYEFTDMYPPMIAKAQEEEISDAVRSFTWANEAEKEHADLYSKALAQLEAGEKLDLPAKYYVCPLCGDTFAEGTEPERCPLCNFPKAKYIEI